MMHGEPLASAEDTKAEFIDEIQNIEKDVLISSESIGRLDFLLSHLGAWIAENFDEVRILFTARHPLSRAASNYNQSVKDPYTGISCSPDAYLKEKRGFFLLAPLIERFSNYGHPLDVIAYEPAETFVARFLEKIGHPQHFAGPESVNRSMSGVALVLMLIINKLFDTPDERKSVFTALNQDESLKVWEGNSFPFSRTTIEWFEANALLTDQEKLKQKNIEYPARVVRPVFQLTPDEMISIKNLLQLHKPADMDMMVLEVIIDETVAAFTADTAE